ncbi:MAG TPA: sensor histidine kinase KdpD, partial [Rhizomicrobium sp.]|nr:sensor histidine kinase KdpD [Rhizomicrobium sp.]
MNEDRPDRDLRPSPEALLEQSERESRGRLKVFLGAAPGVGKTYEMLSQGRQRRLEGIDVVIGVVETHGRIETDRLAKGFEVIPKKRISYKGRVLAEMDLDAILQRRPKLVLVDELAHTNLPGSRHPKRYLDVQELLEAGIDVYTTLNVQHLESLNDVVARITRIRVRETVPDSFYDKADDVELVDLTPDDLIQRLKEGKVYVPEQAQRAVRHYFMPGNLTALRELALRRTAQRVDEQMVNYMRAHAIQGPWEAGERILVSVGTKPGAVALVRYARRLADRLRASWTALYVETSQAQRLSENERDRVAEALRVAQRLGGEAVTLPASSVADGVIEYAQANNFTHIVVATARRPRWLEMLRPSAAHEIIRRAGDLSIHVVPEVKGAQARGETAEPDEKEATRAPPQSAWRAEPFVGSLVMVAVALVIGLILQQSLGISNIALVFFTAVVVSAVTYGLWPALFACFVSVLAYNFFFLPPLYTFTISDRENVVALFFFGLVAVIASNLASRVRDQVLTARERAKVTEDLYLFSRKLAGVVTMDDLLWATAYQIAAMLKVRVVLLLPEGDGVSVRAGYPPEDTLDDADLAAARWAWAHVRAAGRGADTLPGAKRLFLPMRTGRGPIGIIGLDNDRPGPILSPDQRRLLDALADQASLAIERVNLVQDIDRAKLTAETERLRSALLTSISHDLRTPLASILGSASSLKAYRGQIDEKAQEELIQTIQDESERLNRFINNLLDMTRLESGAITVRTEATDLADVIGSAIRRASRVLGAHRVKVEMTPDLPMPKLDAVLLEQVIFNLLDNAAKYAPPGSEVAV